MYGWWHSLAVVTLLAPTVYTANIIPKNERCVTAVYTALNYVSFIGEPKAGLWLARCQNSLKVTSIYAGAEIYCDEKERAAGFAQLNTLCQESANVGLIPRQNVAENLTKESIEQMRRVEFGEVPRNGQLDYPVLLSTAYYNRTFRTISTWQTELRAHYAYSYFGYFYWGCIVMVGMLHRLLQHVLRSRYTRGRKSGRLSYGLYKAMAAVYQWINTHFIIAFPLKRKILWFDLPTRIDAILVVGYWILSIMLMSITYYLSNDNIYWPDPSRQLLRYIADRTGIMSFANLFLIWIFAGRNNILIWSTGWSFAKFNIFHRHVAWIATLQAVIHTLAYLTLFVRDSGNHLKKKLIKSYLLWGSLAIVAMVLILPLAIKWMRQRSYEVFLLIHIAFSIATIVGCFYHVIIFEGQGYDYYLWPVAFIWVSDRFLRLTRVVYCNLHIRLRLGGTQTTRSTATYDPASNVVRLEVIPGSVMHQPTASSFYYLYQPFRFRGWESHPFTLGSWEHTVEDQNSHSDTIATAITEIGNDGIENSKTPLLNASISQRHTGNEDSYSDAKRILERPKLIFWIRPYNGWTRSLRDQCLDSPNRSVSPTILLEGPYGESFSLGGHEPVLLIAGGTGIACAVPYIRENLHRSKMMMSKNKNENDDSELLTHTRIHLVWASRETAFVHDVASRELRDALSHEEFHASFYITGKQQETSSSGAIASPSSSISFFSFSASSSLPNITNNLRAHDSEDNELLNLHHGRPNIQELVLQHAQDASEANYSLLVVVSGPSAMADETRAAVYLAMRRGYRRITFREDSFSW